MDASLWVFSNSSSSTSKSDSGRGDAQGGASVGCDCDDDDDDVVSKSLSVGGSDAMGSENDPGSPSGFLHLLRLRLRLGRWGTRSTSWINKIRECF